MHSALDARVGAELMDKEMNFTLFADKSMAAVSETLSHRTNKTLHPREREMTILAAVFTVLQEKERFSLEDFIEVIRNMD